MLPRSGRGHATEHDRGGTACAEIGSRPAFHAGAVWPTPTPPTARPTTFRPRCSEAVIIVPPWSTAVPSETAETEATQRDRHLHSIAEHGRAAWQKASGYTKQAHAEAAIGRFKQVIGDGLRSRTDQRRATEVNVAVHALNRMLELGRPISVRIA